MKIEFLYDSVLIYKRYSNRVLFDISHDGRGFDAFYDNDYNAVVITGFNSDRRTAKIKVELLVFILKQLKKESNFIKLEFAGFYEKTEQEILKLINEKDER